MTRAFTVPTLPTIPNTPVVTSRTNQKKRKRKKRVTFNLESNQVLEHKYGKNSSPFILRLVKQRQTTEYTIDFTQMTQIFEGRFARKIRRIT